MRSRRFPRSGRAGRSDILKNFRTPLFNSEVEVVKLTLIFATFGEFTQLPVRLP